jgi:hypothetical protein
MARKPTGQATGTAVANFDEELARQAEQYKKQEESSGGLPFFSVRGAVLTFAGNPIPNNEVAVIVADFMLENAYYDEEFDSDSPQPPACFAFGRDESDMSPHSVCVAAGTNQNDACGKNGQPGCCQWNEFGSADKGRGKACKNTRRLVLLPVPGTFDGRGKFELTEGVDHAEFVAKAGFGFYRLPVTSVKGFANFVNQVANVFHLPPHAMFTRMSVVPDASDQFKVIFEPICKAPRELLPQIMARHHEAVGIIETPYPPKNDRGSAPRSRASTRTATKKPAAKAAPAKRSAGARR